MCPQVAGGTVLPPWGAPVSSEAVRAAGSLAGFSDVSFPWHRCCPREDSVGPPGALSCIPAQGEGSLCGSSSPGARAVSECLVEWKTPVLPHRRMPSPVSLGFLCTKGCCWCLCSSSAPSLGSAGSSEPRSYCHPVPLMSRRGAPSCLGRPRRVLPPLL